MHAGVRFLCASGRSTGEICLFSSVSLALVFFSVRIALFFFYRHLTGETCVCVCARAHCIKKDESRGGRKREGGGTRRRRRRRRKKRSERKGYERTRSLSLSLSSSPSFRHSTTYAEVGGRTRERERRTIRNYCRLEQQNQQQQMHCVTQQC